MLLVNLLCCSVKFVFVPRSVIPCSSPIHELQHIGIEFQKLWRGVVGRSFRYPRFWTSCILCTPTITLVEPRKNLKTHYYYCVRIVLINFVVFTEHILRFVVEVSIHCSNKRKFATVFRDWRKSCTSVVSPNCATIQWLTSDQYGVNMGVYASIVLRLLKIVGLRIIVNNASLLVTFQAFLQSCETKLGPLLCYDKTALVSDRSQAVWWL